MRQSLFRRGRVWHCKVKLDTWANEKRFSLETTDRRIAASKLQIRLKDLESEAAGILPPLSLREAAKRPLSSFFEAFLRDMHARQKSPNTVKLYGCLLRCLSHSCQWVQLRDVTVSSFCEWRNESDLSPKSLNNYLNVWSRLFRWLKRQRLTLENPFEYVDAADTRQNSREYRRALTTEEVLRLLAAAPPPRSLIYRLALETGLRRHELRNLRWGDFLLGAGAKGAPEAERSEVAPFKASGGGPCVRVPASISKNRKTVLQPLGADVVAELITFRPRDVSPFDLAFVGLVPKCPTFRKDLAKAGIPFVDDLGRRADLHALRKTHGTALVLSGAEPRVVMESMRHSELKLTMKTYMDARQLCGPVTAAVERLPWHTVDVTQTKAHA